MIIYSVWDCDSCDREYFTTKGAAQIKAKELLTDILCHYSILEDKWDGIYDTFYKEDEAYYYECACGGTIRVDLVSVDRIEVKE